VGAVSGRSFPVPDWADAARDAFQEGDVLAWRNHSRHLNPEVGLWWNKNGICSVCGPSVRNPEFRQHPIYQDHCHSTGLARGWLCGSCNVTEGQNNNALWHLWRRTAPMLVVGERWFYGWEGRRQVDSNRVRLFSDEELLSLTMDHLLAVIEQHRHERVLRSSAVVAAHMSRLFGGRA